MRGEWSTIEAYFRAIPADRRQLLEQLRAQIKRIVPDAQECISYRMPAFRLDGVVIAGFAATAQGGSYYPFSGSTLKKLAGDLRAFSQTPGALHFSAERPLPAALVRKLLKARIGEIDRNPRGARAVPKRRQVAANTPGKRRRQH